jgi:hypothetical protein
MVFVALAYTHRLAALKVALVLRARQQADTFALAEQRAKNDARRREERDAGHLVIIAAAASPALDTRGAASTQPSALQTEALPHSSHAARLFAFQRRELRRAFEKRSASKRWSVVKFLSAATLHFTVMAHPKVTDCGQSSGSSDSGGSSSGDRSRCNSGGGTAGSDAGKVTQLLFGSGSRSLFSKCGGGEVGAMVQRTKVKLLFATKRLVSVAQQLWSENRGVATHGAAGLWVLARDPATRRALAELCADS